MATPGAYDFSFSGLKTAVINQAHKLRQNGEEIRAADFAASIRRAVVDLLVDKSIRACLDCGDKKLAIAGGVSSNLLLRREIQRRGEQAGLQVFMPERILCTDNAAMIGSAAFYQLMAGHIGELSQNAVPTARLGGW